jgi:hypothetical protein
VASENHTRSVHPNLRKLTLLTNLMGNVACDAIVSPAGNQGLPFLANEAADSPSLPMKLPDNLNGDADRTTLEEG